LKYREIREKLKDTGFEKVRQKGSHETWFKPPDTILTISGHDRDTPPIGTEKQIKKQAGWGK
jgi:predicted RNA binding protein YcfA (HicA-like mRNA interferase family)